MATVKDALNAIESHERECKALYKSIDKRLEDGLSILLLLALYF